MAVIVQKYGGSSVADVGKIRDVARKIADRRAQGDDLVVVVSAMGDTTDELLALAKEVTDSPSRRELDMLLTAGERISMALLSMALNCLGVDAVSFTGSQSGIITTDTHTNARILEVRPFRILEELAKGRVVIVAGYQGVSQQRKEVTTLGRGGSDTTAVALAAALNADACEIYSDVDGVFSADPRVAPQARKLAELTYEEMQTLAESGAKVLNAQAVEFARRAEIAIHAKATAGGEGTVVQGSSAGQRVSGVSGEKELILLRLSSAEHLDAVLEFLDAQGAPAKELIAYPSSGFGSLLLSVENVHHFPAVRAELERRFTGVQCQDGIGAVSVVGIGIAADGSYLRRALSVLERADIPVEGVHTASLRLFFLVPEERIKEAVRLLHDEFLPAGE